MPHSLLNLSSLTLVGIAIADNYYVIVLKCGYNSNLTKYHFLLIWLFRSHYSTKFVSLRVHEKVYFEIHEWLVCVNTEDQRPSTLIDVSLHLCIVYVSGLGFSGGAMSLRECTKKYFEAYISACRTDVLVFSSEFTAEERKTLHLLAQSCGLKSQSRGRGNNRWEPCTAETSANWHISLQD